MMESLKVKEAIEKARADFKTIQKSGNNPAFKSKYSTLDDIFECCQEGLKKQGLSVSWTTRVIVVGDKVVDLLKTEILHKESGETLSSETTMLDDTKKGSQALGSGMTYMRRYQLQAMLALEADEDTDDDGNKTNSKIKETKNEQALPEPDFSKVGKPFRVFNNARKPFASYTNGKAWLSEIKKENNLKIDDNKKEIQRVYNSIKDADDVPSELKNEMKGLLDA